MVMMICDEKSLGRSLCSPEESGCCKLPATFSANGCELTEGMVNGN